MSRDRGVPIQSTLVSELQPLVARVCATDPDRHRLIHVYCLRKNTQGFDCTGWSPHSPEYQTQTVKERVSDYLIIYSGDDERE